MTETMKQDSKKDQFLIDGFPRNKDNLDGWNTQMGDKAALQFVLFFDCDEKVCFDASDVVHCASLELKGHGA